MQQAVCCFRSEKNVRRLSGNWRHTPSHNHTFSPHHPDTVPGNSPQLLLPVSWYHHPSSHYHCLFLSHTHQPPFCLLWALPPLYHPLLQLRRQPFRRPQLLVRHSRILSPPVRHTLRSRPHRRSRRGASRSSSNRCVRQVTLLHLCLFKLGINRLVVCRISYDTKSTLLKFALVNPWLAKLLDIPSYDRHQHIIPPGISPPST